MSTLRKLFRLAGGYRKLRRYQSIATVLARHGFGDIAARTGIGKAWWGIRQALTLGHAAPMTTVTTGERLRLVFEELGPTFIKFGQMLANRPDILPPEVIRELARLQDQVPPFPFARVQEVLEQKLGSSLGSVFTEFDREAMAAASIAQVHRAVLASGEVVAVKVRRPDIERTVREDLKVLRDLALFLSQDVPELAYIQPVKLVEEFARTLRVEMDFTNEVRYMERFARNFADEPRLRVPRPYAHLCSSDLIVMEFIDGVKVTDVPAWTECPLQAQEVAELGTRFMLKSVFEHRFYHADPHPGNFLITPDGRVGLLDFGMMGYIDQARMEEMLSFMVGLVSYDSEMLVEALLEAGLAPEDIDVRALRRDLDIMMDRYSMLPTESLRIEPLLRDATEVVFKHHITLPADLLGVGRAISVMEGIARRICPGFNPLQAVQPYLVSLFLHRALDPSTQSERLVDTAMDWLGMARTVPRDVREIIRRVKAGDLTIRVDDVAAVAETQAANRRSNRLAGAVVAGVGVAGSCALLSIGDAPHWLGYAGLACSFLLSVWVLHGIRRSGGM